MDKHYELASEILEDVRQHIDRTNYTNSRLYWIRDEFTNKVRALSRCYARLEPFLDKLCKAFNASISKTRTKEIIEQEDTTRIMKVFREEAQIPVLLMQVRRDERKKKDALKWSLFEEKNNEKN